MLSWNQLSFKVWTITVQISSFVFRKKKVTGLGFVYLTSESFTWGGREKTFYVYLQFFWQ